MQAMFVHLRLHTEFSVVDGTNRIDEVAKTAAKDGQPALAITDLNNLFGAIKFYKEARGKGVKPVLEPKCSWKAKAVPPHPASSCWCKTGRGT
jgi:DNA polymerase-3 subunit alpha